MFLGYTHTHTCNHPSRELNIVSLQQYCFAANCRPQRLGKSCPAPSMFLWFLESAYRCSGASPGNTHMAGPRPQCCFRRAWLLLTIKTHWMKPSKLQVGCRPQKSSKENALPIYLTFVVGTLKLSWVLPRLCKIFTWADPPTLHSVLCFPRQAPSPCRWSQDRRQTTPLGSELLQPLTLRFCLTAKFVSHNSLFP